MHEKADQFSKIFGINTQVTIWRFGGSGYVRVTTSRSNRVEWKVLVMDKIGQNTQNDVGMTRSITETGFAPLAQVEAYWEALRGNRLMPTRAEIDPRGIEQALEYSFIVERIAPGIARLRIAGSHLNDLMGMEVRGMPLTAFMSPASRRQLSDTLEDVFETPATSVLTLHAPQKVGVPSLDAKLLLMPLQSDLGDVSRILGALVSVGDIGRGPRRFEITGSSLRPIVTDSPTVSPLTDEKLHPASPAQPEHAGFSEQRVDFESETPRRDAPYLRLVKKRHLKTFL